MIESGKLNGYLVHIKKELRIAEKKHQKFCDRLTNLNLQTTRELLRIARKINAGDTYYATRILDEELYEALEAYNEKDKSHCFQELAQCGAVILRMMEYVDKELTE